MSEYGDRMKAFMHDVDEFRADEVPAADRPAMSEKGRRMLDLVAQLSPESRARIARRLDDRFHEITGTPRTEDDT